jgi:hypothetical protein
MVQQATLKSLAISREPLSKSILFAMWVGRRAVIGANSSRR